MGKGSREDRGRGRRLYIGFIGLGAGFLWVPPHGVAPPAADRILPMRAEDAARRRQGWRQAHFARLPRASPTTDSPMRTPSIGGGAAVLIGSSPSRHRGK